MLKVDIWNAERIPAPLDIMPVDKLRFRKAQVRFPLAASDKSIFRLEREVDLQYL